jgi:hypothetical protein
LGRGDEQTQLLEFARAKTGVRLSRLRDPNSPEEQCFRPPAFAKRSTVGR